MDTPRKILMMIKAGPVVDIVIDQLSPLLSPGDVIMDGGNSHFKDSERRLKNLANNGIQFMGIGISGGEEGALKGPSIMPGGTQKAYNLVEETLETISAKDRNGKACCSFIGPEGSGHFVKMIHNGIEYAEMQLLAEIYALLRSSFSNEAIADHLEEWGKGNLSSYLLGITVDILRKKEGTNYLLDKILDKAGNKGTGSWSTNATLELGYPATMIAAAVFARYTSAFKSDRKAWAIERPLSLNPINIEVLREAYRFARLINHHQGFELIRQASLQNNWSIDLSAIARIWTNGCIIRSTLMENLIELLGQTDQILGLTAVRDQLSSEVAHIQVILQTGITHQTPLPCFSAAFQYWLAMTSEQSSANLIQAQRDYFGAHTYKRIDAPENQSFHTQWT